MEEKFLMRSTNKKFISALACASAMTALAIADPMGITKTHQVVQAATDNVPAKSAGVDVSSWQGTNLTQQAKSGAKFAVVKVSESTNYQNPHAQGQINNAEQNNMMPMGYHYAHFGADSNRAVQEGNYAVNSAQQAGLPQGSYLAADWEQDAHNNTNGGREASANAITSFMDTVHNGGYNPMLYSSEWLLKAKVDTNKVTQKYPNSLWVASYKTMGRQDQPDYNYFPSMNNVAIWQYTQNKTLTEMLTYSLFQIRVTTLAKLTPILRTFILMAKAVVKPLRIHLLILLTRQLILTGLNKKVLSLLVVQLT